MKLLFIDYETQSDDAKTTNPTEVGCLLVSRRYRENEPDEYVVLEEFSQIIYDESYPPQTQEIVDLTGITDEMLKEKGRPAKEVFSTKISPLVAQAQIVMAHNRAFDQTVYESTCSRLGLDPAQPSQGWLCTIQDIPWPKKFKCKKQSHLAYDHGILVHPDTLHRALDDVKLLFSLVTQCHIPFEAILEYWRTPWAILRANVQGPWQDGGVGTGQAKKLGYSWEKIFGTDLVFPKMWVKRVRETEIEKEKQQAPFKITRLIPNNETTGGI